MQQECSESEGVLIIKQQQQVGGDGRSGNEPALTAVFSTQDQETGGGVVECERKTAVRL